MRTTNGNARNILLVKFEHEFTFNVNLSYAGFTGTDGLEFTLKNKSNSNSTYEGYNISKSAKNNLFIDSDYGSVKMNRL